jgi:predicted transcriptional regulator
MFDFDVRDKKNTLAARMESRDEVIAALNVAVAVVPRDRRVDAEAVAHAVRATASISEALQLMAAKDRSHLPLMDDSGALLGTVSTRAIADWLLGTLTHAYQGDDWARRPASGPRRAL